MKNTALDPARGEPASDAEMAERIAARDEAALRLLMKRHNQRLFRTARAILKDDAEAEEAVQDAYLKAIRGIEGFRRDAKLSTWLTRIAANEALERLRRRKRAAQVIPLAADLSEMAIDNVEDTRSSGETPEDHAMRSDTRRIMEAKIDALPDDYRAVFMLRAVEELTVEETSAVLGIPEATVRTRHFRARSLLRESLARELDIAAEQAFHFAGERCDRIVAAVLRRLATD